MRGSPLGAPSGYGGGYGSNSAWAAAPTLGINPNVLAGGRTPGGGRNVAMSAMRIHRLRALAVQKLAEAYKQDEIASSVMVMQGGSVFDDIAERVLKVGESIMSMYWCLENVPRKLPLINLLAYHLVFHILTYLADPNDANAKYVHFFHEKIPSRSVGLLSLLSPC